MSKSQYTKRRDKEIVKEVEEGLPEVAKEPGVVYTQTALDIFSPDGGTTYEVAEISFDPVSKKAEVINIYSISRLVGLTGLNQKVALNTLKRKLVVK
jgi:hypothetical protein